MTLNTDLVTEIQGLNPSAIIELFTLDAVAQGGDVLLFHAGTNGLKSNVIWQGDTYVRFPIEATGFEFQGQGQFPRPKLKVSNALSVITTILLATGDLIGAKITRTRTLAKFLDAENFTGGVNPDADDTANFADDIYYIDRKSHEDRDIVEFELASSVDLAGVQLPRRQVIQNICTWQYRGAECGFTGAPVFDANDDVLLTTSSSEGLAVIAAYNAVQAAIADLALKETALSLASSAKGAACEMKLVETRYDVNNKVVQSYLATMAYDTTTAVFSGVPVSLGSTYRQGASKDSGRINYAIEYWAIDAAGCTTATTAYNSALTARNTAQTTLDSANTTLTTALAALPVDDPLYTQDKCGKRLTSCKNRFGATEELPFGAFPAAGLAK